MMNPIRGLGKRTPRGSFEDKDERAEYQFHMYWPDMFRQVFSKATQEREWINSLRIV